MRSVISALVINEPGVLSSVAGMFAARGFNIDSLVVGRTEDAKLSRLTVVCDADENTLEQVRKQLAKLVPVVKVRDFKETLYVERDLALISVSATPEKRSEIIQIVSQYRANIIDVAKDSLMVEVTGNEQKIESLIELLGPYGIKELARTGVIAMARGMQPTRDENAAKDNGRKRVRRLDAPATVALPPS